MMNPLTAPASGANISYYQDVYLFAHQSYRLYEAKPERQFCAVQASFSIFASRAIKRMAINPYESPLAECSPPLPNMPEEQDAWREMQLVIRLYWWMGVVGLVFYACLSAGLIYAGRKEPPKGVECLGVAIGILWPFAIFTSSLVVSKRLASNPKGMLSFSKWVGLIMATAWFPFMTVPALMCRRRLNRYYASYCDSLAAASKR
jgi:hypothetical protein